MANSKKDALYPEPVQKTFNKTLKDYVNTHLPKEWRDKNSWISNNYERIIIDVVKEQFLDYLICWDLVEQGFHKLGFKAGANSKSASQKINILLPKDVCKKSFRKGKRNGFILRKRNLLVFAEEVLVSVRNFMQAFYKLDICLSNANGQKENPLVLSIEIIKQEVEKHLSALEDLLPEDRRWIRNHVEIALGIASNSLLPELQKKYLSIQN